jgi:hypothetical protein
MPVEGEVEIFQELHRGAPREATKLRKVNRLAEMANTTKMGFATD